MVLRQDQIISRGVTMKTQLDLEKCTAEVARLNEFIKDLEWEIEDLKLQNKELKSDLLHERHKAHRARYDSQTTRSI